MFKLYPPLVGFIDPTTVVRLADNAFIPFCPDNTDYQQFKVDVEAGAELLDAEGNVMTAKQVEEFIKTLP